MLGSENSLGISLHLSYPSVLTMTNVGTKCFLLMNIDIYPS